jgi:hypothetical protein
MRIPGERSPRLERLLDLLLNTGIPTLATGIGCIFAGTGLARIVSITAFLETVRAITGMPEPLGSSFAVIVVLLEIVCGTALFLRKHMRIASIALATLVSLFIAFLFSALLHDTTTPCMCFGILGISMSIPLQLALDFVLLDALACIALASGSKGLLFNRLEPSRAASLLAAGIMLLYVQTELVSAAYHRSSSEQGTVLSQVLLHIHSRIPSYTSAGDPRLLFLLRFQDFNCPPCYDDFLLLSDALHVALPHQTLTRVLAIVGTIDPSDTRMLRRLERWRAGAGLSFPVLAVQDSLLQSAGILKSTVAVIRGSGQSVFQGTLPIGREARQRVLRLVSPESHETSDADDSYR